MIFADRQTATNTGTPLVSYGEYFVRVTQGPVDLQLRKDSAVKVQVPPRQIDIKQIPMWNGDSSVTASLSGYNYINQFITVTMQVSANKGVDWQQVTNPASAYALFDGTSLNIHLDSLIKWTNCDRLNAGGGPKTTVLGYFSNNYNPNTATSFMGEEPSMLYWYLPRYLFHRWRVLCGPAGCDHPHTASRSELCGHHLQPRSGYACRPGSADHEHEYKIENI